MTQKEILYYKYNQIKSDIWQLRKDIEAFNSTQTIPKKIKGATYILLEFAIESLNRSRELFMMTKEK